MKKIGFTAAALAAASVLFAPAAQADVQDFLNDVHNLGWYAANGDSGLLRNGYQVCTMLNNMNGVAVTRYVYENTDYSVSRQDAFEFVVIAVQDLCPWHDHRSQGAAA